MAIPSIGLITKRGVTAVAAALALSLSLGVSAGLAVGIVVPSGTYRGPDGWIVLQVLERQWQRLCDCMGRPDLAADPRYATQVGRVENASGLIDTVEAWMATFDSDRALLDHLEAHRIPAAPVLDPADAMRHPHFVERGMVRTVADPVFGDLDVTGLPAKFGAAPPPETEPNPASLGQHNAEVLAEVLGLSGDEIDRLADRGVLMADPPFAGP